MGQPHSQDGAGEVEIRYSPEVIPSRELGQSFRDGGSTRAFTALAESELFELEFVRSFEWIAAISAGDEAQIERRRRT
jgi:hypothetical protein